MKLKTTNIASKRLLHCSLLVLSFFSSLPHATAQNAKPTSGTTADKQWHIKGLQAPAEILLDRWGVPHIYAANEADLFFVQGFNVAKDRLFQIDLWRRRGLGQLASVFGSSFIEQDRATRLFLYRGDMKKEWMTYGKGAQQLTEQFVAGINAYIDFLGKHPENLPPEFRLLNYHPAKWQAEDVVRIRSHGLTRNLTSEVARSKLACAGKAELDEVRQQLSPTWKTKLPEGLDPCLPDDILRTFTLATQNVQFDTSQLQTSDSRPALDQLIARIDPINPDIQEGSNNWVIAPARTSTGRAILANDPHRAYTTPSLRYITHLHAPGVNVIGAGEPALPGISIGHNGSIAFGLTIISIDQEDLYVYDTNPTNAQQYRYRGKWESMRTLSEKVQVKNQPDASADLQFTRHGPIIYRDVRNHKAYAVRSAWMQAGMAPYFGSVDYMRATNFAQFKRSMRNWGAPTENQVYADTKGNIGWVPGGLTPIRPNWDGLYPVPGDGRYEWKGFLSGDKLPSSYNPKNGWFASANELNLPQDYPYRERKLGFEWPHPSRYQRIAKVLEQDKKFSLEDSLQLQNDVLSLPAQRLVGLLKRLTAPDAISAKAQQLLSQWDYQERADSAAAALFQVWLTQTLAPAYKEIMLGQEASLVSTMPHLSRLLDDVDAFHQFPAQFGDTPMQAKAMRDALLFNSLKSAYVYLEKVQGTQPQQWRWGALQTTQFPHPFGKLPESLTRKQFSVPGIARGGSAYTVNQSTYRFSDFVQLNGASFRVVIDVGNWDASRAINTPGQSGDPASAHFSDLAEKWAKGEYFPLLYTRDAIEANTEQRWRLVPAK